MKFINEEKGRTRKKWRKTDEWQRNKQERTNHTNEWDRKKNVVGIMKKAKNTESETKRRNIGTRKIDWERMNKEETQCEERNRNK